jgi:hypothetical protein
MCDKFDNWPTVVLDGSLLLVRARPSNVAYVGEGELRSDSETLATFYDAELKSPTGGTAPVARGPNLVLSVKVAFHTQEEQTVAVTLVICPPGGHDCWPPEGDPKHAGGRTVELTGKTGNVCRAAFFINVEH